MSSCASVSDRKDIANKLIKESGYESSVISSRPFKLFSSYKIAANQKHNTITIVIEGDGYSWVNRHTVSDDPTPKDPVGLKIASSIEEPAVYLARPCQYVSDPMCNQSVWSSHRFSSSVIQSYMDAFNQLKVEYNNSDFHVVAYSGGAFIALVLAAQRDDISKVSTVAGVLDPNAWTDFHDISALSHNYVVDDLMEHSGHVDFNHMCGGKDDIVPCSHAYDFADRAIHKDLKNHQIVAYEKERHDTLWTVVLGDLHY